MPRGLLPSGRSNIPILATSDSSSNLGTVHPVALDSGGLSSAIGAAVHPVIIAGGSSGRIITKASAVLDYPVGRISLAADSRVTGC